jgi:hypothetical protein
MREPAYRLYNCERCQVQVRICERCDHGNVYCAGDPPHIKDLADQKRSARRHRAMDRLHHAAPSGAKFFAAAAQRGVHLGTLTRGLTDLLDTHGAAALEAALSAALAQDSAHLAAVRHFVDQHRARRGARPPIPVHLPDDPRVRALSVRPHNLADYEQLTRKDSHERLSEARAEPDRHDD